MPLSITRPSSDLLNKLPPRAANRWGALPIYIDESGCLHVALRDPDNIEVLENLKTLFGTPIIPLPCAEEELLKAIREHYGFGAEALDRIPDIQSDIDENVAELVSTDSAMVRFVDDLIRQAYRDRATDIHIEPFEDDLVIRFRIDGILHPIRVPSSLVRFQPLLLSRIKIMAQMNIAEKRLPQDGRIQFSVGKEDLDIRVSTLPTIHGESLDLRLLPRTRLLLGLEQLGMSTNQLEEMERLICKPNGIILVTGPTGHGKTTTLYACLSQINSTDKKIVTIEDPVEYRLKGINQLQVHSKIGLTFAQGLRSVLRQDPDIIMVGEIRDLDTAEIAIRASLTGHLVFSTLHTNDAVGAITRLIDMGIESYLVGSSINAVLAQRLVRLLCTTCGGKASSDCSVCRGTGYSGRTGIFEFLLIDEAIRQNILKRSSAAAIRNQALANGMKTLFRDGVSKVERGLTNQDEVLRVAEEF